VAKAEKERAPEGGRRIEEVSESEYSNRITASIATVFSWTLST
jgi:hypothetical protein